MKIRRQQRKAAKLEQNNNESGNPKYLWIIYFIHLNDFDNYCVDICNKEPVGGGEGLKPY